MPYNINMIFIETSLFTKIISTYLNDDEYAALQSFLVENLNREILLEEVEVSENFVGQNPAKANVAASELSISLKIKTMKFGC